MVERDADIQYLRDLRSDWWKSSSTCITVARIIDNFGGFSEHSQVIDFFENPQKWQHEVDFLKAMDDG